MSEHDTHLDDVMSEIDEPDTVPASRFIVFVCFFVVASLTGVGWWLDANLLTLKETQTTQTEPN